MSKKNDSFTIYNFYSSENQNWKCQNESLKLLREKYLSRDVKFDH